MAYNPVRYVKGDRKRIAYTPSEAVAAEFEGFKKAEPSRAELQAEAKAHDIPANQSNDALKAALADGNDNIDVSGAFSGDEDDDTF